MQTFSKPVWNLEQLCHNYNWFYSADKLMEELIGSPNFNLEGFQKSLISWAIRHVRVFAWRLTKDPYHILIAETFLHRTQAKQVEPIYLNFIREYPNINALVMANERHLRKILFPLGLEWRVKLLRAMAKEIKNKFNGKIPFEKSDLIALPGIGDYIASAVRCFAFDQPDAVIDTNVMRVITRLFDVPFRDSLRRNSGFRSLAQVMVDKDQPRLYNLGMLDLAFLVCKPKVPDCPNCPVKDFCITGRKMLGLQ
jgi:A/G-specific adenine glycosylase